MKVSTRKYWQHLMRQAEPVKDRRKANGKQRKTGAMNKENKDG